jgi:hypothetical protein
MISLDSLTARRLEESRYLTLLQCLIQQLPAGDQIIQHSLEPDGIELVRRDAIIDAKNRG